MHFVCDRWCIMVGKLQGAQKHLVREGGNKTATHIQTGTLMKREKFMLTLPWKMFVTVPRPEAIWLDAERRE